ncbi:MAG: C-GCAxxG-C-C family protein [Syntrophomonas sp.]
MSKSQLAKLVQEDMKSGSNCCQAILAAVSKVWDIPLGDDMLAAAALFGGGMGSGCTCGALTGMVMAAGIMDKYHPHPAGSNLSKQLHDQFKHEFGSTCCRVIKNKRTTIQKIGNKACMDLTGRTAEMLVAEWERFINAPTVPGINNNSNSK